jgi:hypothetical protein
VGWAVRQSPAHSCIRIIIDVVIIVVDIIVVVIVVVVVIIGWRWRWRWWRWRWWRWRRRWWRRRRRWWRWRWRWRRVRHFVVVLLHRGPSVRLNVIGCIEGDNSAVVELIGISIIVVLSDVHFVDANGHEMSPDLVRILR